MKQEFVISLQEFKTKLSKLRKQLREFPGDSISKIEFRRAAESLATEWVEDLRSPLEHKFCIDKATIEAMAEQMKKLHQLSRPSNQKSSYLKCLDAILNKFDDKFVLPIQQSSPAHNTIPSLFQLIPTLRDADETEYLTEAIKCAQNGHDRAAVVMGWCAAVNRIQRKFKALGFDKVNSTSRAIKAQQSGKYKRWNKEFNITSDAELQSVFDSDLIILAENMGLLDGNESERLETCFQYRNHSAHPGEAPIETAHVVSFFVDVTKILLTNAKFR